MLLKGSSFSSLALYIGQTDLTYICVTTYGEDIFPLRMVEQNRVTDFWFSGVPESDPVIN